MSNKISVIVPVYNAENYIDNCINSILSQSFNDFEIVLVDDGSADSSGEICDRLSDANSNIRVFHTANKGAAAARNYGVKKAMGEFICFIDADDTVEENYLKYLMDLIREYDADISVCGYNKVYEGRKNNPNNTKEERFVMTGKEAVADLLYQRRYMSVPWGSLQKRTIWDNVSFPEGTKAEDMGTIYKMYGEASKVAYGSSKLYNYYQRKTNTIYSTSDVRNIDYLKHSRDMVSYVKDKFPDIKKSAYSRHFSTCFQILSETAMSSNNRKFNSAVYKDIRKLQLKVLNDSNGKGRNRVAALMSLVSVRIMHAMLRVMYKVKRKAL